MKGQEFPAHKLILKARSPVFASMFRSDANEKRSNVVDIDDCDPSIFSDFLYFLYGGSIEYHSRDNDENLSKACNLFTLADKYNVGELRSQCWEFMINNLSPENFSEIMSLPL